MTRYHHSTIAVVLLIAVVQLITGDDVKGSVQLNSGTFDKLIPKFKAALVKFDKTHAFSTKHTEFKKVAAAGITQPELLVAEVSVQEFGAKENSDLMERFGVKKEDFPEYLLFLDGKLDTPIVYTGNKEKADDVNKFVIKETGLWLDLPSIIEEFDGIAKRFLTALPKDRKSIFAQAEKVREKITSGGDASLKERAEIYVKFMKKVLESGVEFIKSELVRVEKLIEGKVSEKKKAQLKDRATILTSFLFHSKDEL